MRTVCGVMCGVCMCGMGISWMYMMSKVLLNGLARVCLECVCANLIASFKKSLENHCAAAEFPSSSKPT